MDRRTETQSIESEVHIMSGPLNEAMLLGSDEPPAPGVFKRHTDSAVRVFLAAYRNN